jgi:hypothetical protein
VAQSVSRSEGINNVTAECNQIGESADKTKRRAFLSCFFNETSESTDSLMVCLVKIVQGILSSEMVSQGARSDMSAKSELLPMHFSWNLIRSRVRLL